MNLSDFWYRKEERYHFYHYYPDLLRTFSTNKYLSLKCRVFFHHNCLYRQQQRQIWFYLKL